MKRYSGNAPKGDGWQMLGTVLAGGWNVWVKPVDGYGVGSVKVVSVEPRVRKANYVLEWSTRLGRLSMSSEHNKMMANERKAFSQLTEVLRDHYMGGTV